MSWLYTDKVPNKYYEQKWSEWHYGKPTGYKYWQYRPWMIKDNWKPLKKNWRKKWTTLKPKSEISSDIWKVVNLMTFGVKNVKSEENINNWVQPHKPLKVTEACAELWISVVSFYYYLNKYPEFKEQYNQLKENRREYMREVSENNIQKALTWKMKTLKENEVVDYSFKMLERTDKNYNPKQIVETTVEEINPDRSTDDILWDIMDLLK